jgi:hypothetical protein
MPASTMLLIIVMLVLYVGTHISIVLLRNDILRAIAEQKKDAGGEK